MTDYKYDRDSAEAKRCQSQPLGVATLRQSPTNPRKTFPEAKTADSAAKKCKSSGSTAANGKKLKAAPSVETHSYPTEAAPAAEVNSACDKAAPAGESKSGDGETKPDESETNDPPGGGVIEIDEKPTGSEGHPARAFMFGDIVRVNDDARVEAGNLLCAGLVGSVRQVLPGNLQIRFNPQDTDLLLQTVPSDQVTWIGEGIAPASYKPADGAETETFLGNWCRRCARDKAMREGRNLDEQDDEEVCPLIDYGLNLRIDAPMFPVEWRLDARTGAPCCTAFVEFGGEVAPSRCERTADMFQAEAS